MQKAFLTGAVGLICTMLCACNASFNDPNASLAPPIDSFSLKWFNTHVSPDTLTGFVELDNGGRCNGTLPPGSRIVVGWELPNNPLKVLYFYGKGTVNPNLQTVKWALPQFPVKGYKLDVTIDSVLPVRAIWRSPDSVQQLAIAHLFLTTTQTIQDGDTLLYSDIRTSDLWGGIDETVVEFEKNAPSFFFVSPGGDHSNRQDGFNFLRGYKDFVVQPSMMRSIYSSNSSEFYLGIDKDGDDTHDGNPFWLMP